MKRMIHLPVRSIVDIYNSPTKNLDMNNSTLAVSNGKKSFVLRRLIFSLITILMMSPVFATQYWWVGNTAGTNNLDDRSNWSSLGVGQAAVGTSGTVIAFTSADILTIDGSDISSTTGTQTGNISISAPSGATTNLAQILLLNNANFTITASGTRTFIINGTTGTDFSVATGCTFSITGSTTTIELLTGTTGSITGTVNLGNGSNQMAITVADAGALVFNSGAICNANGGSGGPFGNGTTTAPNFNTANAVVFASGSTFVQISGGSPQQLTQPNSLVVFQTGSLYKVTGASLTPSFSGRTYSNFEFAGSGTSTVSGGAPFTCDNLTITSGTVNIGMTGTGTNGCFINGNLSVATGLTLTFNPSSTGNINFQGNSKTITLTGTGAISLTTAAVFNITGTSVTGTMAGNVTVASGCTWNAGSSTLTENSTFAVSNGGTYNSQTSVLSGSGTFNLNAGGTIGVGHTSGINTTGTGSVGAIQTNTRTFTAGANYIYNSASSGVTQSTGTALPQAASQILTLTINRSVATDTVVLTNSGTTRIGTSSSNGTLTLTSGIFKIGIANTIEFTATQTGGGIVNNGGNFANTPTTGSNIGYDGGTVQTDATSGGAFTLSGTGQTIFHNLLFPSNATFTDATANTSPLINDTMAISNNNFAFSGASSIPRFGATSTLIINDNGNTWGNKGEWAVTSAYNSTLGVTQGYPNNLIVNADNYGSFTAGNHSVFGNLTINFDVFTNTMTLNAATDTLTVGGNLTISGGKLQCGSSATVIVKGNYSRNAANATFLPNGKAIIFSGSGTSGSPQTISVTSGAETQFNNLTISNGTYVKLNSPVTLPSGGVFTLTSGILQTDITNLLRLANSANTAIGGNVASATNLINGPVRQILSTSNVTYTYPVGSGTTPLPLVLASTNTTASDSITVQAFTGSFFGTGSGLGSVSNTEHWTITTTGTALPSTSTVGLARPASGLGSFTLVGASSTTTGSGLYSSVGGGITGSGNSSVLTSTSVLASTASQDFQLATSNCGSSSANTTTYSGSFNSGTNDGTGFSAWTNFTGAGANGGTFVSGATNINGSVTQAWGIYGYNSNTMSVVRPFNSALTTGSTFQFQMQTVSSVNGSEGFSLYNASGNVLMELYDNGSAITLNDASATSSGTPTRAQMQAGVTVYIAYTAASTYSIVINTLAGANISTFTGRTFLNPSGGQVPAQARFFTFSTAGSGQNLYFNNFYLNNPVVTAFTPTSQTDCQNATPTNLSVTAFGNNVTYQWYNNGNTNSTSGGSTIGGATSSTYTPSTSSTGTVYYYCIVTGCSNTYTTTSTFSVTVTAAPTATTNAATSITTTTATLNGTVNANGSTVNNYFDYGTTATYSTFAAAATPTTSTGAGNTSISLSLSSLTPNTLYHFKDSATGGTCPASGSDLTFTTLPNAPTASAATSAFSSGFTANWTAPSPAGSATYTYTVLVATDNGFTNIISTKSNIASGSLTTALTGLVPGLTYYYKVAAVNAQGTGAYSNTISLTTNLNNAVLSAACTGTTTGSPGSIVFTYLKPTIDGTIDSVWNKVPVNTFSKNAQNTPNNTVTWQAMYTADTLYVLAKVIDANIVSASTAAFGSKNNTSGNAYDNDGVEIFIAGDNTLGTTYNNKNDFQLRFNAGFGTAVNGGNSFVTGSSDGTGGNSGTPFTEVRNQLDYATATITGGYTVEVALPWRGYTGAAGTAGIDSAGITIANGNSIGIEFSNNDNDNTAAGNNARQSIFQWAGTSLTDYQNPSGFGHAALSGCGNPPTLTTPTATSITNTTATLGATVTGTGSSSSSVALLAEGTAIGSTQTNDSTGVVISGNTTVSAFTTSNTALSPQTKYFYQGYATNSHGETGYTAAGAFFYTLSNPPTANGAFTSGTGCVSATLNWSTGTFPGSGANTKGYILLRAVSPTVPSLTNSNGTLPVAASGTTIVSPYIVSTTLTYNDATVSTGTTYNYVLVAFTSDSVSAGSHNAATYNYLTGGSAQSVAVTATSAVGTASGAGAICSGSTTTVSIASATGTIQWQSSTDGTTYNNISGANSLSYTTPALNSGLYYKAQVTSGNCSAVFSTAQLVTVNQSNAGDGVYGSGWSNGQNDLTTGLGAWSITTGSNYGFLAQSSNNGGVIDVNGKSWGEFANSGATASAVRPFSSALSIGNTVWFTMQNGSIDVGGTVGFGIQNGSGQDLLQLYFIGGQSFYKINDNSGSNATTIGYNNTGLSIEIAYTASNTYSMKVTVIGGSSYYFTGTFQPTGGSQVPAQVRFFNANAGNGTDHNAYYNSLSLNGPVIASGPSASAAGYCLGSTPSNLSVTAYGTSLGYAWQQSATGTGSWSAASGTNNAATYTPPTSSAGTLYYRVIVSGLCTMTDTSNVSGAITINAKPSAPSAGNASKSYTGVANTTAITATPGGGETIDWYAAASGAGAALLTGNTSYTPTSPINAGTYTYYAEARNTTTGCVSATRTAVTLTINGAILTITANNATKTYGTLLSNVTGSTAITVSGLQNGETVGTGATANISYGTGAAANAAVSGSPYTGSVTPSSFTAGSGATYNAANYTLNYVSGDIIINPATLTITANDTTKVYGAALSTPVTGSTRFTSSGLQNGETIGSVTMTYGTGAAATDAVGTYSGQATPSAATGGTFTAANYSITYTPGAIIVTPAALTITATDTTKLYGTTINGGTGFITFTSSGLQNGENIGSVTIQYNTGSQAADAPGTYSGQVAISAATGGSFSAGNYTITYVPGNIIVAAYIAMWSPKGGSSTDWWDANNWSNNTIPDQYKSAMIATDSIPYPVLSADGTVYGLNLAGAATLDINGKTLTIDGPVSGTGALMGDAQPFDPGAGTAGGNLVIGGTAGNINFTTGYQSLFSLSLLTNASATLATPLDIAAYDGNADPGTLNLAASAVLNTGGGLSLKSADANTAQVTELGNGASINGDATVERYIRSSENPQVVDAINYYAPGSPKRAWRLMTAPVSGTQTIFDAWQAGAPVYDTLVNSGQGTLITGANPTTQNGLDAGINGGSSLKIFDSTSGSLLNVNNTKVAISNNNDTASNKGYFIFIRGDRDPQTIGNPQFGGLVVNNTTLSAKGKLQTGRQIFNIQSSVDTMHKKFALIGNPYMSPIDLNNVTFVNVAPFVYTWDPNLNQVGGYVTLDGIDGYIVSDVSTAQNKYIQSGQAFFIFGGLASDGPSKVIFNESSKAPLSDAANNNQVFRPATASQSFRSSVYLQNGSSSSFADGTLAQYDNTYCACVDFFDAPKLPNINEQLGLSRNGALLSIERRPLITNPDTLFLNLTKTTQRNYSFHFVPTGMANPGLSAFLKDAYLNDSTQLSLTDSMITNFSIDANVASQAADRFMIVFEPSGVVPVTYTNVKAWQQNSNVSVEWSVNNQLNIKSYDVETSADGITFTKAATVTATAQNNGTYDWIDANAVSGDNYYRIRSIGSNGAVYYSTIVKVKIGAGAPAIAVYPNPIRAGVIGLQMTNMAKGKYSIHLVDGIGQVLMATEIEHAGGSANQTIRYNNNLAKGVYHVEVNGPNGYRTDIKVMN